VPCVDELIPGSDEIVYEDDGATSLEKLSQRIEWTQDPTFRNPQYLAGLPRECESTVCHTWLFTCDVRHDNAIDKLAPTGNRIHFGRRSRWENAAQRLKSREKELVYERLGKIHERTQEMYGVLCFIRGEIVKPSLRVDSRACGPKLHVREILAFVQNELSRGFGRG
jgi:hypothetical protein